LTLPFFSEASSLDGRRCGFLHGAPLQRDEWSRGGLREFRDDSRPRRPGGPRRCTGSGQPACPSGGRCAISTRWSPLRQLSARTDGCPAGTQDPRCRRRASTRGLTPADDDLRPWVEFLEVDVSHPVVGPVDQNPLGRHRGRPRRWRHSRRRSGTRGSARTGSGPVTTSWECVTLVTPSISAEM
jgi:hypothetical protein